MQIGIGIYARVRTFRKRSVSPTLETMTSPLADFRYEPLAYDLVRYRESALDDQLATFVRDTVASDEANEVRWSLDEDDQSLLITFARRRIVKGLRDRAAAPLLEAFDTYALLPAVSDGEMAVWFKAGLFIGANLDLDLDALAERLAEVAPPATVAQATIAFDSLDRVEHLAHCQLVETSTSYGPGLLNTIVVRNEPGDGTLSGIFGAPARVSEFAVGYDQASRVATIAARVADAFDVMEGHSSNELRHDQLVASSFDVVTGGSFLPARACVSFHVTATDGLSFTVVIADVDAEQTGYDALELAEAADDLVDQASVAVDSFVALLTVVPNFDDMFGDDVWDEEGDEEYDDDALSVYLDTVRQVLTDAVGN